MWYLLFLIAFEIWYNSTNQFLGK
ncbi:conserved hypothetical protein [Streptococcus oralis Uo5]|uniref:Uncharacterized protein n=1 Tax=Streptococcus oralis (strain Uo5) TaxID=927666 RepID=F2QFP3_STROU|nr:conserved hypothetical protein [Streptococcus oralis Uo5]